MRLFDSISERERLPLGRTDSIMFTILGGAEAETGAFLEQDSFFCVVPPRYLDAAAYLPEPTYDTNHTYLFPFYLSTQLATSRLGQRTYFSEQARRLSVSARSLLSVTIMTLSIFAGEGNDSGPGLPVEGMHATTTREERCNIALAGRHFLCERRISVYHPSHCAKLVTHARRKMSTFSRPPAYPTRRRTLRQIIMY